MSGSEVRSAESVTTPFDISSPAPLARPSFGPAPMATITTSAGSTVPDEVSTDPTWPAASPWNSAAVSPKRNSTPCASCSAVKTPPSSGPIA